jgi:ribosomal protein S18 acetylase RimI-like enzyme
MSTRAALLRREGVARDGRRYLIRPSGDSDAAALLSVRHSVAAEGDLIAAAPGEGSALEEQLTLAGLLSQGGLSLTLEVEGRVAGHLMARRVDAGAGEEAEIAIAVQNSARGVGLGRTLMETAIDWARAVRVTRLVLGVFPTNIRAITLYRSLGFRDGPLRPGPATSGGRKLLLMSLSL